MTAPVRHTKKEIKYAAEQAHDLGITVRLEPNGAITFIPQPVEKEPVAAPEDIGL